jgi:hypothetical protein
MSNICPPISDLKKYCVIFTDFICEQIEELVSYYSEFEKYLCQIIFGPTTEATTEATTESTTVPTTVVTTKLPIVSYSSSFNKSVCQQVLYIFYNTNINNFVCQFKVSYPLFISTFRSWACQYLDIPTTVGTTIQPTNLVMNFDNISNADLLINGSSANVAD